MRKENSRRSFLKKLGGTTALVAGSGLSWNAVASSKNLILPAKPHFSPNDKIGIGCIGMGIMGFGNAQTALRVPGVELVAVCDLYDGRLTRSKEIYGRDLFTTRNYKEILDRQDIDAVIISTTDHWHDKIAIEAMEKGKAVYCEKPMVQHIEEGHNVIETEKNTNAIFQVGSQRVSSIIFEKAKELYHAGEIGELNFVEGTMDRHDALGAWQYSIPPDASPENIDWETFLGDAPKVPFDPVRFFRWRNYRDYGTGIPGDLFVHLLSGLHVMTDSFGPNRIMATGGLYMWKDGRDVPDLVTAMFDYPKTEKHPPFNVSLRVNFADGSGGGEVTRLVGTEGEMSIGWQGLKVKKHKLPAAPGYGGWDSFSTFPEATQKEFERQYKSKYPEPKPQNQDNEINFSVPKGYDERFDHFTNFFDSMRTGKKVVEDASFGLRAAGPALASNLSYFERKIVNWDPERMKVV